MLYFHRKISTRQVVLLYMLTVITALQEHTDISYQRYESAGLLTWIISLVWDNVASPRWRIVSAIPAWEHEADGSSVLHSPDRTICWVYKWLLHTIPQTRNWTHLCSASTEMKIVYTVLSNEGVIFNKYDISSLKQVSSQQFASQHHICLKKYSCNKMLPRKTVQCYDSP